MGIGGLRCRAIITLVVLAVPGKRGGYNIQGSNFSSHTLAKCKLKKQSERWYFFYLYFLASGNLWLLSLVLILDLNVFIFIHWKNPVNDGSLPWIQPQCADTYDKLPSMLVPTGRGLYQGSEK